jgi:hypothetical protein
MICVLSPGTETTEEMLRKLVEQMAQKIGDQSIQLRKLEAENLVLKQTCEHALQDLQLYRTNYRQMRDEVVRLRAQTNN